MARQADGCKPYNTDDGNGHDGNHHDMKPNQQTNLFGIAHRVLGLLGM